MKTVSCFQLTACSALAFMSICAADVTIPDDYQITGIQLAAHAVIPGQYGLDWELTDGLTGEPIPDDAGLAQQYGVLVLAYVPEIMDYIPIVETLSDESSLEIGAASLSGYDEFAVSIDALGEGGGILASSGFTAVTPGMASAYLRDATDCEELLLLYLAARDACNEKDCSGLKAALDQAQAEKDAAQLAMEIERARRAEIRSTIPGLEQDVDQLQGDLDQLKTDLAQSKTDLIAALQAHFDARTVASGNGPAALPISQTGQATSSGSTVAFEIAPGVYGSIDISFRPSAGELARMQALMERDVQSKFGNTAEYEGFVIQMQNLDAAIAAKEAALAAAEAALQAAQAELANQNPYDLAYQNKSAAFDAAQAAYEQCLREKAELCAEADRLARELERCEKEAGIGEDLDGAQDDEEAAGEAREEAEGSLGGIPGSIKEGDSPAGRKAREAQDDLDGSQGKSDEAEGYVEEAKRKIAEGDLPGAENEAEKARAAADEARRLAEEAKRKAKDAKDLADEEARKARQKALEKRAKEILALERWQKRRKACIEYVTWQSLAPISGQFDMAELAELQDALGKIIDLGSKTRQAANILKNNAGGGPAVEQIMDEIDDLLGDLLGPLEALKDKIDGFSDLYEQIVSFKGNLSTIFQSGNNPQDQADKFGALLSLIGDGLEATLGNVPILQFVTGYFSFIVDGYLAALEGIDIIKREKFERLVRLDGGRLPSCAKLLNQLCDGLSIPEMAQSFIGGLAPSLLNALGGDYALFFDWVEAEIGKKLSECCDDQIASKAPPITYSEWLDGQTTGSAVVEMLIPMATPDPELLDPLGNPSGDGIPNFAKFFLAMDPINPGLWDVKLMEADWDPTTRSVVLVFKSTPGAVGVEASLKWSVDMSAGSWSVIPGVIDFYPQEDGTELIYFWPTDEALLPVGSGSGAEGFYRLRLDWEP